MLGKGNESDFPGFSGIHVEGWNRSRIGTLREQDTLRGQWWLLGAQTGKPSNSVFPFMAKALHRYDLGIL